MDVATFDRAYDLFAPSQIAVDPGNQEQTASPDLWCFYITHILGRTMQTTEHFRICYNMITGVLAIASPGGLKVWVAHVEPGVSYSHGLAVQVAMAAKQYFEGEAKTEAPAVKQGWLERFWAKVW